MKPTLILSIAAVTCAYVAFAFWLSPSGPVAAQEKTLEDLAAWGEDHTNKPIPEYVTGGECLFCHRHDAGENWHDNRHNKAMDEVLPENELVATLRADSPIADVADEIAFLVGHTRMKRFLKPTGAYGQMAVLSAGWIPPDVEGGEGKFVHGENPFWDNDLFANQCAGCHATAVDPEYMGFSAPALDCFTCHGNVPAAHNADTSLVYFGKGSEAGVAVEMSICAQCHLRGAKSEKTGLPYPTKFVAGDNLFKDFKVDLSEEHIAGMNPADRHVYQNVRDVLLLGKEEMTCVTCHDVHDQTTRKHRVLERLQRHDYCAICHDDADDYKSLIEYEVHSETCQY